MLTAEARLRLLCELSRRLATSTDPAALLSHATRAARELCDAEACVLRLLDGSRPALFLAGHSASESASVAYVAGVRVPAHGSIAGWVVRHDQAVLVDDVDGDPRFQQIARPAGTRAVLCVPLRTSAGTAGALEMVDPRAGHFSVADRELLEALAAEIAVAYEKTLLAETRANAALPLGQAGTLAGIVFIALGLALMVGALFVSLVWALPLSELPTRPGTWSGLACLLAGTLLVRTTYRYRRGRNGSAPPTRLRPRMTAVQEG